MQKSDSSQTSKVIHRKTMSSTTLNRKYVKRPVKKVVDAQVKRSSLISHFQTPADARSREVPKTIGEKKQAEKNVVKDCPIQRTVNKKTQQRPSTIVTPKAEVPRIDAQELKNQAIKKALLEAEKKSEGKGKRKNKRAKVHFGFGRVVLALSCAAVVVLAIVYFVNMSMPDISLRVAAMQTGIDASYPSYVPRDYTLSGITSENGRVTLNFRNPSNDDAFTIVEEASSWDSNALLSNYVKENFGNDYSTVREQGLTIYIDGSDAAWVNGGVVYKLDTTSGELTNKQIKSIATSL